MEKSPFMKVQTLIIPPTDDNYESDDNDNTSIECNSSVKENKYDVEHERWIERTDINKITLECMMNKKHYKTYLEKTNPTQLKKSIDLQNKIKCHSFLIENIFDDLLENSKNNIKGQHSNYNNEIQRAFNKFLHHIIEYIEETSELNGDPTPEMIVEDQLKKDYGEFEYNVNLHKQPGKKFNNRPDFFTPPPVKTSVNKW